MSSSIIHVNATGDAKAHYAASPLPLKLVGLISNSEFRESITRCNRALAPGWLRVVLRVWTFLPLAGWPIIIGLTFGTELVPFFAPAIYMVLMMLNVFLGLALASSEEKRRQRLFRSQVDRENEKYNSPEWRGKDGATSGASMPRISWAVKYDRLEIEIGEIKPPSAIAAAASVAIAEGQPMLPHHSPFVMPLPLMHPSFPQFAAPPQGVPMHASRQPLFLAPAQYGSISTDEQTSSTEGMVTAQDALLRYTAKFSANHQASAPSSNDHCAREGTVCAAPTITASAQPAAAASGPVAVCPGCFHAARPTDRFCSTCGAVLSQKPRTPSPQRSLRLHQPAGAGAVVKSSPSVL